MSLSAEYYEVLYLNAILFLIFITCFKILGKGISNKNNLNSFLLAVAIIFYMGLRPINGAYFGDMSTYNRYFNYYADGGLMRINKDILWEMFMKFCSTIITAKVFFFLCAFIYVVPLYIASKRWFSNLMYIPFLMILGSFSFWSYGTNGIRNGIATSLIILALSLLHKKKLYAYTFFTLAFFIHSSVIIPIVAYLITLVYNKPKYFLYGWLFSIIMSLSLGSFWQNLFSKIGFNDERLGYLTDGNLNDDVFAYTGFRWDFLLYSVFAIYAGYYFLIKRGFKDEVYSRLFNIYVITNSFWILVIRANFSNRFAYLSWFLMAVIIFYPFFKQQFFKNQLKVINLVMTLYFGFTYLMYLIK